MKKVKAFLAVLLTAVLALSLCSCLKVTVQVSFPGTTAQDAGHDVNEDVQQQTDAVQDSQQATEAPQTEITEASQSEAVATQAPQSEQAVTDAPQSEAPVSNTPTEAPVSQTPDSGAKTPDQMSAEEALTYFNKVLNEVKTNKVGLTKSKITRVNKLELSNSGVTKIANSVKSMFLSEKPDVTEVKKGESSNDVLSPSGKAYASTLTMSDVASVKAEKSGANYVITVSMRDTLNPTVTGPFGKVFDFMTADAILNDYAPKVSAKINTEDLKMNYTGCYAKLTVSSEGRVVAYQTYVNCDLTMTNVRIAVLSSDVAATLASTTDYSNFVY